MSVRSGEMARYLVWSGSRAGRPEGAREAADKLGYGVFEDDAGR